MEHTQDQFAKRYTKLNKAQRLAVDTIDGPVLVVAGPGSGKTEILSLRVGNILKQTDVAPSNILCLTFTDSAAVNMRKRLASLIGRDAYRVAIHTFHSFGVEVIDRNPEFFYNGANFIPADDLAQLEIVESILSNRDHDDPLRSQHPEQGFVYSKAIVSSIAQLKKAGLVPSEFRSIIEENEREMSEANHHLAEVFDARIARGSYTTIERLADEMREAAATRVSMRQFPPWRASVAASLTQAIDDASTVDKATPLSAWKTKYTKKDEDGNRVHRDWLALQKMKSLASIYEEYRKEMFMQGYYDFDDMLLETIQAIESNDMLRYDLQEQFQYILVDEFQDSNDAQMRLLHLLSDASVNEGRPNVMAVGDDDQAIYKFQGAELSNIIDFTKKYRDPAIITMTDNYRSTQSILDASRHVILKGDVRLENTIEEMVKDLKQANKGITDGTIMQKEFETESHEYYYIIREIEQLMANGVDLNDIAVISRTHKKLQALAPYFHAHKIPVNYERQLNVFDEPHIHQLITMGRYIRSLARKDESDADHLLPEILSYPFWGLSRETIWNIAVKAEHGGYPRTLWLEVMRKFDDEKVRGIAALFDRLAGKCHTDTLESVFDDLVGSHLTLVAESEDEDDGADTHVSDKKKTFVSPFREFYFGKSEFEKNKARYLPFLSSLRVFVHALREYRNGERLTLDDMVEFVDLHVKNDLTVTDTSPFTNADSSVTLLTAHKAKGLEFDTVFVLSCQEDVWASRPRGGRLTFPMNVPITPAGDAEDDWLRIFYVAMTRAERNLYLTSYERNANGKESAQLRFIVDLPKHLLSTSNAGGENLPDVANVLAESWDAFHTPPFVSDEKILLQSLLEEYQMPVTHLNNYLDVSRGGPQTFLEHNLLRFPQSMSPAAGFGSSMHKAIELVYTHLRKDGKIPSKKKVLEWFERELAMKRLSDTDHQLYLARGIDALTIYYESKKKIFDPSHRIELNFKDQGVLVGAAHLTGKIDKMIEVAPSQYTVVDFKTGHALSTWSGKTPYEKIKLHNYKRQLVFYKILVENSRDYAGRSTVVGGSLEFLEPLNKRVIELPVHIEASEVERTTALIEKVYSKILNLDFPDVSDYSLDLKGIIAFEDDLLT